MRRYHRTTFFVSSRWTRQIWICLALLFSLAVSPGGNSAWAQPRRNPPQPPKDDLVIDPVTLPPTWKAPPERLPIVDLDQPIATKEELEKIRKDSLQKYSKTRIDADLSAQGKKVIEDSIRYKLAYMTLKDVPGKNPPEPQVLQLPQLHKRFIEEVQNVGGGIVRPAAAAAMVDFIGKEVVRQIPPLLKNNFYVRLHAVMILGEMDYAPAYALLLQVIAAPDIHDDPVNGQPDAIKIAAASSLIRLLTFAVPPATVKDRTIIAHTVVDELTKNPKMHWWLQIRLIEVLRHCDITGVDAGNNKPFVVDLLVAIIKDTNRLWTVRAKACYVLGRVPLPPTIRPADVVTTVADFALQLSDAAAAKPNNPAWRGCFWDLYLTFRPNNPPKGKDLDAENKLPGGFLARIKPEAQPAYDVIVPIVNDVLNDKAPAAGSRQALGTFVKGRPAVQPPK